MAHVKEPGEQWKCMDPKNLLYKAASVPPTKIKSQAWEASDRSWADTVQEKDVFPGNGGTQLTEASGP